jgi:hypothetical protein
MRTEGDDVPDPTPPQRRTSSVIPVAAGVCLTLCMWALAMGWR